MLMISGSSEALVLMMRRLSCAESSFPCHQYDDSTLGTMLTQAAFLLVSSRSAILCASGSELVVIKMTILPVSFMRSYPLPTSCPPRLLPLDEFSPVL